MKNPIYLFLSLIILSCTIEDELIEIQSVVKENINNTQKTSNPNAKNKVNEFYTLDVSVEGEGEVKTTVIETGMAISVLSSKNKTSGNSSKAINNIRPSDNAYINGTTLKLQAYPKDGYIFNGWTGDIESSENPLEFKIDKNINVTAVFSQHVIYLDKNGVTIKARETAQIGDKGIINGETYTVVNLEILKTMISEKKDITKVVTTKITNMATILDAYYFPDFNQDISSWDLSNVTDISGMFYNQKTFNQNISAWNVSNVTNMAYTFTSAHSFNQPLDSWDTSNVVNMNSMFWDAKSFNQDLNNWDVSKVTNMLSLFDKSGFNGDVSSWDVSNVKNMFAVFAYTPFNKDISDWNVSNVENMAAMFYSNFAFNQDISNWDISNVRDLSGVFGVSIFNQDISNWDTSNVTTMFALFGYNDFFNQDISNWDVSKVENMQEMFVNADRFNQDISNWDVSNVTNMNMMFQAAASFNQDLSGWCVSNITEEPLYFSAWPMDEENKPIWGTCPD